MNEPTPIPFHRHVEVGRHLHETIELLWSLRSELSGRKRSSFEREAAKEVGKSIRQLDILRNDLENLLFTSGVLKDKDVTCNPCGVYYGPFSEVAK